MRSLTILALAAAAVAAAAGAAETPVLKLPYASYAGTVNPATDTITFKNIRFAAPPLGPLRWAPPAPPLPEPTLQNGSVGNSCLGSSARGLQIPGTVPGSEDCLFLDLTVPKSVLAPGAAAEAKKLPVVVWIYGGAYVVGNKEQGESPQKMIQNSGGNLIWVAGNYRLGAFGFMNGATVEAQGTPNAGLHDQRAVFKWVQDHIHLVSGDKEDVTAMGISAGGGSIVHHLILDGGSTNPLFHKAILQSPGYSNAQDRAGYIEGKYLEFEIAAGCKGKGLACLRGLSTETLVEAGRVVSGKMPQGQFAWGPSPDGKLIRGAPVVEFAAGRHWKGLRSLISSHAINEGASFADSSLNSTAALERYVTSNFGELTANTSAAIREAAGKAFALYAPERANDTILARASRFVTETSFTCHSRAVADAYPGKTYAVVYAVPPSTHGSDQCGTFLSGRTCAAPSASNATKDAQEARQGYQSLLLSYIVASDPNKLRNKSVNVTWPLATYAEAELADVLWVNDLRGSYSIKKDPLQNRERCGVWVEGRKAIQRNLDARDAAARGGTL